MPATTIVVRMLPPNPPEGALQLAAHRLSPACRGLSNREKVLGIIESVLVQSDRVSLVVKPTRRASAVFRKRKIAPPMIA
jgi:hypothetical protein